MKTFVIKQARIFTALLLALALTSGALAATVSNRTVTIETSSGRFENVKITETTDITTNSDGSKTEKKEGAASSYKTAAGFTVGYSAASNMTTGKDGITRGTAETEYSSVNGARTYAAIGGSSTAVGEKAPLAEIEIPLISEDDPSAGSGEATQSISGPAAGTSESTGDLKAGAADGEYDYTTQTVLGSGSIRVTTKALQTEEALTGVSDERDYHYSDASPNAVNDLFTDTMCSAVIPENKNDLPKPTDGFEYVYIGGGYSSQFWAAYWYTSKSADYQEEEPFYTDEDNVSYYLRQSHKVPSRYNAEGAYLKGKLVLPYTSSNPAVYSSIYHFTMAHPETGKLASTYCADLTTHALEGYSYNLHNLEDTNHYTKKNADKIRAVAMNGYWGIADDPETVEAEPGSLAAMQAMMRSAVDPKTNQRVFTEDEINLLTDGVALTATQYAIWAQSNQMNDVEFINTHLISKDATFKNTQSTKTLGNIPESMRPKVAVLFKLYNYLANLPAMTLTENTTANTIINADNFQKSMRVIIKDKPANYANNLDDNPDNDVYLADLRFALVTKPLEGNGDDLTIRILDENNYELASGRIASSTRSGETLLVPDAQGYYTFRNIPLTESAWKITVALNGTQNLARGVCLYTSEVKDGETSQMMVGVAEGERSVNVKMTLTLDFEIEDSIVETYRMWRSEVPVDSIPDTGDKYTKYLLLFVLSGAALCAFVMLRRRKRADV